MCDCSTWFDLVESGVWFCPKIIGQCWQKTRDHSQGCTKQHEFQRLYQFLLAAKSHMGDVEHPGGVVHSQIVFLLLCCCLVAKPCPLFCDSMDCSPPGSSVHGISQVRILEWVAISFSRGSSLTQGSNPSLLHWQADSLLLNHCISA